MRYISSLSLAVFAAAAAMTAQTRINPVTQVNWPALTGNGAPSAGLCTASSYGQKYIDIQNSVQYVCGSSGWFAGAGIYKYVTSIYPLSQANSDLIAAGGGTIVVGAVPVTLNTVQQIGTNSSPNKANLVSFLNTGSPLQVTTGGALKISSGSRLEGASTFQNSTPTIQVLSGSAIGDLISAINTDTTQESFSLSNLSVSCASGSTGLTLSGTITSGSNTITGIASTAGIFPGSLISSSGFPSGTLVYQVNATSIVVTQNASQNATSFTVVPVSYHYGGMFSGTDNTSINSVGCPGYGLVIDGGVYQSPNASAGRPGFSSDLSFHNWRMWGKPGSGFPVVGIYSPPNTPSGAGVFNVSFSGLGDVESCSDGVPCIDVNGYSLGNGSGQVIGVHETGTLDIESRAKTNGIRIRDSHNVEFSGITAEAPNPQSGVTVGDSQDCVAVIDETYVGSTNDVHVQGSNFNWPCTVLDWVESDNINAVTGTFNAGSTSLPVAGLGQGGYYPMPGQPIYIMDGQNSEIVYAAYGYSGGLPISIDGSTRFNHSATSMIAWGPDWEDGPGPAGNYQGVYVLGAGAVSNDGTGVITITTPDNYAYEDHHIGGQLSINASSSDAQFQLGQVTITGLGSWCTIGGARGTCANNQIQIKSSNTTAYTNVAGISVYFDVATEFNHYTHEDKVNGGTQRSSGIGIPTIRNGLDLNSRQRPSHLSVYDFAADYNGFYRRLWLGAHNPIHGSATDEYIEAQVGQSTSNPLGSPALHVGTGLGVIAPTYLSANGTDYWKIDPSDGGMKNAITGFPVATINGSTTANDLAMFNAATGQIQDSGVTNQFIPHLNIANTWTGLNVFQQLAIQKPSVASYTIQTGNIANNANITLPTLAASGSALWTMFSGTASAGHSVRMANDSASNPTLLVDTGIPAIKAAGTATLSSGTVTVSNTAACTVSGASGAQCLYTLTNCGASGTVGQLSVGTITAGTSFVINSSSATDTSLICWSIRSN